jgi:PAS domain S-box-containing protein
MPFKRDLPSLLALFVGAIMFAFTVGLCVHERETERARLRAVFDSNARQTAGRIEQRVANYEQMLRGVQGMFSSTGSIDRLAFETYVDTVMAGPDAAGLQSVAFTTLVARDELPAYVERQRKEGWTDFRVRPPGDRDLYGLLLLVAPDSVANRLVLGFDSLSEPTRRTAMLQARDSGNAALTGLVQLRVDSGADLKPGCLIYLPVYAKGSDTHSIAQRRLHGVGWVRAAFRVGDLMSTLYGEQSPGLVIRLYDGADTSDASLMYRSDSPADTSADAAREPRFQAQEYLTLAGHTWTLQLMSLPEFERENERGASSVILVAGFVLSLMLVVITHQLVTGRTRAYAAAKAMTRELRASEERYRRIVETAGEGIWLLDAARRIAFVNPRIAQWLGTTEAAMQGRPLDDFMDPEEAARCRAALAAERAGEGAPFELRLRRGDGSAMWVSLSMRPIIDETGHASGALGMLTDINERRLAEERRAALEAQLRDSQKMEAIGTLAGGIAHDFNNILAAIIGNVAAARQDSAIGLSGDSSLAQIERAAVRARSLVQQILTFSRMQVQELHTQALQPVIEETLEMLRAAMPAQVELVVNLPSEPVHVRADATQIQQIVMNLCTNAWHALPAGRGRIEVSLVAEPAGQANVPGVASSTAAMEATMPAALLSGPRAHLSIADNGSGMDEATRARVFEPFFTTKQVGQGTGLGLAVVHGIVSVHGGAIHVDSTPGRGSRFDLWFPLQDAPPAQPEAPRHDAATPRGSGQHVLCVDDDPAMVLMVDGLLRRAGYEVTVYEQPAAALAAVRGHPSAFDIVVTDFNMPEMNGMELAQALSVAAPRLPVIITSGFISDEMRQQATALHIGALLQKEYTLERLAGLVDSVLAQHRADA